MRLEKPTALFLALLLCACGPATNETVAGGEGDGTAPAPAEGPTAVTPQQQPRDRSNAPEQSDEVTLTAAPQQVKEGATVTLTLHNGSNRQLGYNLCTSSLETAARKRVPTSRVCTMELRTLEPRRTATYRYELPVNMVEGSYRLLTDVERMGTGTRTAVRSNSIEIRSD